MNARIILKRLGLLALAVALGAGPATTQPDVPDLTPRQQDLLLQLSDAESNIQAVNKALQNTGYHVGVAYDRIDSSLKGNEIMNRQGGGPVRWDEFYGKTAKDYPRSGGWNDRMDDHRPRQFQFVYKANNDQIARAKNEIASLLKNQQALLDRRRKHEEDQSRLWAVLAWEQVKDREVEFRPLYRFALKPAGPEAAVLRPLIQFLRAAGNVAHDGLDSIQANQASTFQSGSKRMDSAYAALQESLADALNAPALQPDRVHVAQVLKTLCKQLAEQSKVIADDYSNAADRDKAKEDNSKLEFRGQLQSSLSSFATEFGKLDDEVNQTAITWGVSGDTASPTPETGTAVAGKIPATQAPAQPAPGPDVNVRYANGDIEIDTLKNGVKFFKDRKYVISGLPDELANLTFARKEITDVGSVVLDCPVGSTVYMIVDVGVDTKMEHAGHAKFDQALTDSNWVRLKDTGTHVDKWHHFLIYKAVATQAKHLTVSGIPDGEQGGIRSGSITVASSSLKLSKDDPK